MLINATITDVGFGSDGGLIYRAVTPSGVLIEPVLALSNSGDFTRFTHFPYAEGSEVLITTGEQNKPPFYIIGGYMTSIDRRKIAESTPAFTSRADYTNINADDIGIRNTKSAIVVATDGVAITSPDVNLQLRGGVARVSQGGVADNQVLNADATINTLIEYITNLEAKIYLMERGIVNAYEAVIASANAVVQGSGEVIRNTYLAPYEAEMAILNANAPVPPSATIEARLEGAKNPHVLIP